MADFQILFKNYAELRRETNCVFRAVAEEKHLIVAAYDEDGYECVVIRNKSVIAAGSGSTCGPAKSEAESIRSLIWHVQNGLDRGKSDGINFRIEINTLGLPGAQATMPLFNSIGDAA